MQAVGALKSSAAVALAGVRQRALSAVASPARLKNYRDVPYKAGDNLLGYTVTKVTPVPELHLTAVELRHTQTNAHFLHVARADSNNVFSIGFRTPPTDSSGVTHVLEHVSLCGSRRYPTRDPFFKMLNRSLATYMNAWTASDYTMYPFSTQNATDFKNLLSVYLDAVFFPNIREVDFKQEGWRLEQEVPTDPATPLVFKGVVWNEMKGALSDVDRLYCTRFQQALLQGTTYGNVSGGDPPVILSNLTVDVLRNFHRQHYHPSNSRIYTYGDLPLETHLEYIAKEGLNHFEQTSPHTSVNSLPRWSEPRKLVATCPPDPMAPPDRQTRVSVGWALPREDPYEAFATRVLATLLVEGSQAPMYQALIESHIGTDYSPNTGLDTSTKEPSFSVGLQGLREEDVPKVEALIHSTIEKTIKEGFEPQRVEAILHQIELSQRHQTSSFGLSLGAALMGPWIHETSIEELLQVDSVVKRFRQDLAKGGFLEGKLRSLLQDNKHRLTFVMNPDTAFLPALQEQEEKQLQQMVEALTDADKQTIYQQGLELLKEQEKASDASALPTLHVSDIDRKVLTVEKQKLKAGKTDAPLQLCVQPTNGVAYFRAVFDTSCVPPHLQPYLPLFGGILASMGAGSHDYREQGLYTKLWTGGISVSPLLIPDRDRLGHYRTGVMVGTRALQRNVGKMFALLTDMLTQPHLSDVQRLLTLHKMIYTNMANGVADSGHSFAVSRASSALTPFHAASEVYSGLTQIEFLRALGESNLEGVLEILKQLATSVFRADNVRCAVNVDGPGVDDTVGLVETFLGALPINGNATAAPSLSGVVATSPSPAQVGTRVYQALPVQVNYAAAALPSVPQSHADNAPLKVLTKLLSAKYLHREIREKGGAYGGGLGLNAGVLGFYSYRDPAVDTTLRAFGGAAEWVARGDFHNSDIDEAKLSIFQKSDAPIAPGSRGMSEFIHGVTDDQRQADRDRLFAVQRVDLVRVADQYLSGGQARASMVVIGPLEAAQDYSAANGWTVAGGAANQ